MFEVKAGGGPFRTICVCLPRVFAAGMQIESNDMLRVGDWIEMPRCAPSAAQWKLFHVICVRMLKSALIYPCLRQSNLDVSGVKSKLYEAPAWSI